VLFWEDEEEGGWCLEGRRGRRWLVLGREERKKVVGAWKGGEEEDGWYLEGRRVRKFEEDEMWYCGSCWRRRVRRKFEEDEEMCFSPC